MINMTEERNKDLSRVKKLVLTAVLGAMAGLLMVIFKFPVPFIAPPYMTVDFGDTPSLIAGFALGPIAGVVSVVLKILINLLMNGTTTAYVGELSNVIVGSTFVLVSSLIYTYNKTQKGALIGLVVGLISMTALATLSNYFFIFPLYGVPVESFSWLAAFVVPFNLLKGGLNAILTFLLYKRVSNMFKKL